MAHLNFTFLFFCAPVQEAIKISICYQQEIILKRAAEVLEAMANRQYGPQFGFSGPIGSPHLAPSSGSFVPQASPFAAMHGYTSTPSQVNGTTDRYETSDSGL